MANFSRRFGSKFPQDFSDVGSRKNICNDIQVMQLFMTYNQYIESGDYAKANTFYLQNKNILEPYIIDEKYLNRLEEDIQNTAILALSKLMRIQSQSEPSNLEEGSYWIQEY